MDENIRKSCPNCSQFYHLKPQHSSAVKGNLPLFLECGHSMCQNCIKNIIKCVDHVECKICHRDMVVEASQVAQLDKDKVKFHQLFPVNVHMVGELTLQHLKNAVDKSSQKYEEFFVDLHAILKEGEASKSVCLECQNATNTMCQQCATILCETCFTKSHKNFVIFKNHVLKENDEITLSTCKIHSDKPLGYYCNDCKKYLCVDCFIVKGDKSCKNHDVVSIQEINNSFLEELCVIRPKVDEVFRRLTNTDYDIGNLLHNIEKETGSASGLAHIIANIEQHFSKLCSIVQKHKQEVIDVVAKIQNAEKSSLYNARDDLTIAIKKAKEVMDSIRMTSNPKKIKQMNLAVLLEDAKQIAESPWYLVRDQPQKDPLKVAVNEDLCGLISDYIHLEGTANYAYKLRSTSELGEDVEIPPPPPSTVFAPVLPRDVRQAEGNNKQKGAIPKKKIPTVQTFIRNLRQYRSESGPVTSLNSGSSDSSQNYLQTNDYNRPTVQPVQPFSESQHPNQLQEGAQELIYILHIVNPHHFYVQRACHQTLLKDILRQSRTTGSLPKPSVNSIAEGQMYWVYNNADKMWQRCRVVSINRRDPVHPQFQVFCFDFGSTLTVGSVDKLRLLPSASVQSTFPLAIRCSLDNCEPMTGAWEKNDSLLIQYIINNKQAVLHVRNVRSSNFTVTLECDVTTFEDGVDLAHALVFHERATMPNPIQKYLPNTGIRERAKISMTNDDYKYKTEEAVCITLTVNPDKFYVRNKHQQKDFEQLSLEMEQEYDVAVNTGTIYLPKLGMSCCVKVAEQTRSPFPARGSWARATVVGLPGFGRVALTLVDSGAPLLAYWSALRYLHPKFAKLPALASECHLVGVTPLNKEWSLGSLALMRQYSEKVLVLHVEDNRNRGSVGVTLFHHVPDSNDVVCINQEMIKYKFANTFGIYSFNKCDDTVDQVITNKSPLDKPVRHLKPKPEIQILKKTTPNEPQKIITADLEAKDRGFLKLEAKVLQYQSPSLIYMSLTFQQKVFNELFKNMQMYYSKYKPVKKTNWQIGDRCCTVCVKSQMWRRAIVVELEGENAKVFFSDIGNVETVVLANLAELTPEFASIGNAVIKCHLSGVIPAVGEEWPSLTKKYLEELFNIYKRLFITKRGNFKNKSMPVEIWVYHTIHGSALEPDKSEWRCLNKKIIEKGLGVPDKSEEAAYAETNPKADDRMLSFLGETGSIHGRLQLEPMPIKPKVYPESPSAWNNTTENKDTTERELKMNEMFISDWLPPERVASKEFEEMPTFAPTRAEENIVPAPISNSGLDYVDESERQISFDASAGPNDCNEMLDEDDQEPHMSFTNDLNDEFQCNVVAIHDIQTLQLDIIHEDETALMYEELYKKMQVEGDSRPALNGIFENKACIALFHHGLQWYRASILDYSCTNEKVKVRYVDHGCIDVVDLVDIREIHPEWVMLSPSTVVVRLHGIKLNPEVDIGVVNQEYTDTFLDKGPFTARVIRKYTPCPIVELRDESGELVYQNLIENKVFLRSESNKCSLF